MLVISHRSCLVAVLAPAFLACGRGAREYAITEQGRPFSELNEARAREAPPAVRNVTPERLINARAEPHNWLTYHGTYDGQRFSQLKM